MTTLQNLHGNFHPNRYLLDLKEILALLGPVWLAKNLGGGH